MLKRVLKRKEYSNMSKRFLNILVLFCTASILVFAINGCSNASGAPYENKSVINIGSLKGPTSIGMIKLHEEKPSLSDRVSTNYEIIATPDIMISKILSGEMALATLPTNVAAKLYNKGTNLKLAAITGYGTLYILYQNVPISGWDDLKGKKINVLSKGSTPDILLRYILEKNNLEPGKDVELDYSLEQVELSQLMIAGKADIAILPEPFVSLVIKKNDKIRIGFDLEEEWEKIQDGRLPMSCLVATSDDVINDSKLMDKFFEIYKSSISWVNSNPEQAAKLIEKFDIGVNADIASDAISRCNLEFSSSEDSKNEISIYLKIILDFSPGDIGGKMPDENFYY